MTTTRIFFRKALVGWLAYAMTFGPGTPAALAQVPDAHLTSNDYSNVPLPAKKRPNPNLIFSIDDSGSMDGEIAINANDGAAWYYTAGLTIGSATVAGKSFAGLLRPRLQRRPGHGQQPSELQHRRQRQRHLEEVHLPLSSGRLRDELLDAKLRGRPE